MELTDRKTPFVMHAGKVMHASKDETKAPVDEKVDRAQELGAFLRARRESLDPQRLGLPRYGRTRTPGLRREEVAQLAEIGITWYTKLEQGRPIRVSAKVLHAVASALQCTDTETRYIFTLAGLASPASGVSRQICRLMPNAVQTIVNQLHPLPAVLQNEKYDIVAFNHAFCRLINRDLNLVPLEERNCIYLALTDPQIRTVLQDPQQVIAHMAARLRAQMAAHLGDPAWERYLQRLLACSPEFSNIWHQNRVCATTDHIVCYRYAGLGALEVLQTNWWSLPVAGERLLVYVPIDDANREILHKRISANAS